MAAKSAHPSLDPAMRIVVLYGSERFLIEQYTREFARELEERFSGLQQFTFDGETAQAGEVLDELRSYGLLQRHKLVVVDEADLFLSGRKTDDEEHDDGDEDVVNEEESANSAGPQRRRLLEKYAENPLPDSTLLLRAEIWRKGNLDKLIAKVGTVIECEPLAAAEAARWSMKRAEEEYHVDLTRPSADALVAKAGVSLQRLDTELAKLSTLTGPGGTIDPELVHAMVGLSREEKAWQIQSAIVSGDAAVSLRKLRELLEVSRQDVVPLSWAIIDLLRKLYLAAQMLRRNMPTGVVRSQARLWGDTADAAIAVARRVRPSVLARLLQAAIETDARNKTGVGDPPRSLEALLVRIADTFELKPR